MTIPTTADWTRADENLQALDDVINGDESTTVTLPGGELRDSLLKTFSQFFNYNPRGNWLTATDYAVWDMAVQSSVVYLCVIAHTSGVFATDLADGKWAVWPASFSSLAIGTSYFGSVTPQTNGVAIQGKVTKGGGSSPTATGAVGIGDFNAESDVFSSMQSVTHNDSIGNYPLYLFAKSRGSQASPTIVANGDTLGEFIFQGYDGSNYRSAARIRALVGNTPGVSDMPGDMAFGTTPDGSATISERMRIKHNGKVGINETDPTTQLHVKSSDKNAITAEGTDSGTTISDAGGLDLVNNNATTNNLSGILFRDGDGNNPSAAIIARYVDRSNQYGEIGIVTRNAGGYAERFKFNKDGHFLPVTTNTQDIGASGVTSIRDLFIQNSPTVTSDRATKTNIAQLKIGLEFLRQLPARQWIIKEESEVKEKVRRVKQQIVKRTKKIEHVDLIDGKYVQTFIDQEIEVLEDVYESHPVYDESGEFAYDDVEEVLYDDKGNVVLDKDGSPKRTTIKKQKVVKIPVYEEVEVIVSPQKTYSRKHFGYIADEVKSVLDNLGIDTKDFGAYVQAHGGGLCSLRYMEFLPIYHNAIIECDARLTQIELELKEIRERLGE